MRFPMIKFARSHATLKDFRDYPANLEPKDFTRIHDNDLAAMWDMLNEMYGVFSHSNFTDRHGHADRLRAILNPRAESEGAPGCLSKAPDRLELQNIEFRAARALAKSLDVHDKVAVVDDDYPEVRHRYESAVKTLIDAFRMNGRIPLC